MLDSFGKNISFGGEKKGNALAGTALGLAIPGTVAFLNQLGGGSGGNGLNIFGGNNNSQQTISFLTAALGQSNAERYAELAGINSFKEAKSMVDNLSSRVNELAMFVAGLDKEAAVNKQKIEDNFLLMRAYVDGHFVPGKLVTDASTICPEQMPRYNSWVAPTNTTPATPA